MDSDSVLNEKSQLVVKDKDESVDGQIEEERCSSCLRFPKAVYFITMIELCERFNYYGMRTILILYLTQHLLLKEENAVSIYHLFISLCYITTIFGSFLADNYFGRYKTLVGISIVYTIGSTLMSLTAIPARNLSGPLISLLLISFGTGGVKTCVAPFGGDQIDPGKRNLLDSFFSMFYFAINLGALLSTILTPILRVDVACNGSDDCYPLAFGVPAILMGVALMILVGGQSFYKEKPIQKSIYIKSIRCIIVSIRNWYKNRHDTPEKELLDYAVGDYDETFVNDLRALYRILIVYLPLPIYWALYDQIGSKWTLQAAQMDGEISSKLTLLPDQMSLFNVVLIMALIPVFDGCIYPIVDRISSRRRPLQRMVIGIAITAFSFFVAFILQNRIEAKQPTPISATNSRLLLANGLPCDTTLYLPDGRYLSASRYGQSSTFLDIPSGLQQVQLNFSKCIGMVDPVTISKPVQLYPAQMNFLVVEVANGTDVFVRNINDFRIPNIKGHPLLRLLTSENGFAKYQFQLKQASTGKVVKSFLIGGNTSLSGVYWETILVAGRYFWNYKVPQAATGNATAPWLGVLISMADNLQVNPIKLSSSEVSIFYMTFVEKDRTVVVLPLNINNGSQISILWQLPQYILISIGEILVSITGLSFSYEQAPDGMKSLVNALWFFTVSLGNIIVMVVVKLRAVNKQSWEYLIFGIICLLFDIVFAILAYFYKTRDEADSHRVIEVMHDSKLE